MSVRKKKQSELDKVLDKILGGGDIMGTVESMSMVLANAQEIQRIIDKTPKKYHTLWMRVGRFMPNPQHAGPLNERPPKRRAVYRFKPVHGSCAGVSLVAKMKAFVSEAGRFVTNQDASRKLRVPTAVASMALSDLFKKGKLERRPTECGRKHGPRFEYLSKVAEVVV